ncbi:hypothetical protein CCAN11_2470009 [Capnocytophaga canimorsus]|uniref:Uncharacterized protein n=3 Tax=Capnocytophaga canimorsus TaxID=28188 RepID=A0A0B7IR46_9FLAO|nr:hypothetical protein CCAN11_2470009 [Capnocytophaga canimorsus]
MNEQMSTQNIDDAFFIRYENKKKELESLMQTWEQLQEELDF